jgi:hypothetical protein
VLVSAIVAGVLALLGAGVAGAVWLNRGADANPASGNGSTSSGQAPAQSAAGRYSIANLPENLCDRIDLDPLVVNYQKQPSAPFYQRTLTAVVGTSSCAVGRQNDAASAFLSVTFLAYVYADTNLAVTTQRQAFDTAKLNDKAVVTLTGVGEEAFVYRMTVTSSAASSQPVNYSLEMRDSNLRWTVSVVASRASTTDWTDQERSQLIEDITAAVKASKAKYGNA